MYVLSYYCIPWTGSHMTGAKEELELLHDGIADTRGKSKDHELRTAPILTRDAYVAAGYREGATQYGVLGSVLSIQSAFP